MLRPGRSTGKARGLRVGLLVRDARAGFKGGDGMPAFAIVLVAFQRGSRFT